MAEIDLPEPKARVFSPEERERRQKRLIMAMLILCASYALLHKLMVPLILKLTPLWDSPHARIDWWFCHSILLVGVLKYQQGLFRAGSLLAAVGVLYGVFEAYEVVSGRLVGWVAFSHLLSSIPVAFCCVVLLSSRSSKKNIAAAWSGVALCCLFFVPQEFLIWVKTDEVPKFDQQPVIAETVEQEDSTCGAMRVSIDLSAKHPKTQQEPPIVTVKECGFSPTSLRLSGPSVELRNATKEPLNIHFLAFKSGKRLGGWNVLLKAGEVLKKRIPRFEADVSMIYSDSSPRAGLTALFSDGVEGAWLWTRQPISARKKNGF